MDKHYISILRRVVEILKATIFILVLLLGSVLYFGYQHIKPSQSIAEQNKKEQLEIVDGVHTATGLIADSGLELVISNCTTCHSSKLIIQNRMSKAGWASTIQWMQETQNLWDLGESEQIIIDYLATNYAPEKKGRRARLTNIEWYDLE